MPSTLPRRGVLELVAIGALSGCAGTASETTTQTATTTKRVPTATPPSRELPLVDSFPFEFVGTVKFPESGVYGWTFSGSFTLGVDFDIEVTNGGLMSFYVTEGTVQIPDREDETAFARENVESVDEAVGIPNAHGAVLVKVTKPAELRVTVRVTQS